MLFITKVCEQGWPTQISLWAATWKICQKYWLLGYNTTKLKNTKVSKNRWFSIRVWAAGRPPRFLRDEEINLLFANEFTWVWLCGEKRLFVGTWKVNLYIEPTQTRKPPIYPKANNFIKWSQKFEIMSWHFTSKHMNWTINSAHPILNIHIFLLVYKIFSTFHFLKKISNV